MSLGPEQVAKELSEALVAARQEVQWPVRLELPDAIKELSSWLDDERQWATARAFPSNWVSLIDDVIAAIGAFGPEVKRATESPDICSHIEQCRTLLKEKETRSDPALRQRLRRLISTIRERFQQEDALVAAWADLLHLVGKTDMAERSARQLLSLAGWIGHDPKGEVVPFAVEFGGGDPVFSEWL